MPPAKLTSALTVYAILIPACDFFMAICVVGDGCGRLRPQFDHGVSAQFLCKNHSKQGVQHDDIQTASAWRRIKRNQPTHKKMLLEYSILRGWPLGYLRNNSAATRKNSLILAASVAQEVTKRTALSLSLMSCQW